MDHDSIEDDKPEAKAGYLVIRIKTGWGIIVDDNVEIRISSIKSMSEVQLAIRAPKKMPIRKVR